MNDGSESFDPNDPDVYEELELLERAEGLGCTFCDSPSCNGECEDDES